MSYNEYFNNVADILTRMLGSQVKNRAEVVAYMKTEEDTVSNNYKMHLKDYNAGKFPKGVWEGCINSTAYCLYMLY